MKCGDLVKLQGAGSRGQTGIVVDIIQKKVARTSINNRVVNWDFIDPEPHGIVLFANNDGTITIPVRELEVL